MSTQDAPQFDSFLAFFLDENDSRAAGIRVVEPAPEEAQARRGSLYCLVELMGESPVKGQALEDIQSILQQTYYTAGGPLSAILEQAIQNAHNSLVALNRRSPTTDLRAGILCVAIVQNHLMMASAGPGLALLATESRLDQFPPDPAHFNYPIGGNNPPRIAIYRHQVQDGDVLFVGESDWILISNIKTLGGAIVNTSRVNRFDVVDYLRQQSNQAQILGLLLVLHQRRAAARSAVASLPSGLPTSVSAPPPVHTLPPVVDIPLPPAPAKAASSLWDEPPSRPPAQTQPPVAAPRTLPPERVAVVQPSSPETIPAKALGQQIAEAGAKSGRWLKELAGKVLPERRSPSVDPPANQWVGSAGEPEIAAPRRLPPFTPPAPTRGSRARLFVLLAVLIPILVFATVAILNLREGAATQAEGVKLVDQAENQLAKAEQALNLGDKAAARTALNDAQRYLNEAIALIGLTDRIRELSQRVRTELQKLMNVRSLYSLDFPLVDFPPDAGPQRVVVFDQDVYVLDVGRQRVEHFRTDPGRTIVQERSGPVLGEGDVVEGVRVGRLVDIAWQPRIPGFADKASLLILDRNNNIFRYNRVDAATVVRLADGARLQSIAQLENYNGRLYLADEQANQILRYSPAGLGYDEAPDAWFEPTVQANLAGIVAMAIDSDIWLLMENGTLLRYSGGRQLPFSLDTSAGLTGRLSDMAMGSAPDSRIYLADGSQDRILVFDKAGTYIEQLQAAESTALAGLRGLYLDEVSGTLFILTQTSLYSHPLPN
ncbi:MAG: hypothetical protein KJZ86_22505 [Caldilineaceae bacterium]|nr:hypothetical protein [Caldilineaceae bacterium]